MNEQEVKTGAKRAVCSITGRDCGCRGVRRGCERPDGTRLERLPDQALYTAVTALEYIDIASEGVEEAISDCPKQMNIPEFYEAIRLLEAARKLVQTRL